ncbi:MAG TPA: hypothetical protein PLN94_19925, partial [Thiolinea sp.]|nr:hypothetical protein [Thiolinea sp.]
SGPDEVLAQGRFGPLVPVGDVGRLAQAMLDTLAQPLPGAELQQAVQAYRADRSAREYLAVLQGLPGGRSCAA